MGYFVSVEGIDGSGKSTLIEGICEWLSESNIPHVKTCEPGGTQIGKELRAKIISTWQLASHAEFFLFLADRAQHVEEIIMPNIKQGKVVICDRFTDSTIAYQGIGRSLARKGGFYEALAMANQGVEPDLTLYLQADLQVSKERVKDRDRFEINRDFMEQVIKGYEALIKEYPARIKVINASLPYDKVLEQSISLIKERISGKDG